MSVSFLWQQQRQQYCCIEKNCRSFGSTPVISKHDNIDSVNNTLNPRRKGAWVYEISFCGPYYVLLRFSIKIVHLQRAIWDLGAPNFQSYRVLHLYSHRSLSLFCALLLCIRYSFYRCVVPANVIFFRKKREIEKCYCPHPSSGKYSRRSSVNRRTQKVTSFQCMKKNSVKPLIHTKDRLLYVSSLRIIVGFEGK